MTERDRRLLQLRNDSTEESSESGPLETFQAQTLRPILKLQNTLILGLISVYLRKYCPHFAELAPGDKRAYLRTLLVRDSRPKHMLVGLTAGQFTEKEFAYFCEHEPELRRRLVDLCIQRLQSQIDALPYSFPSGDVTR